MSYDFYVAADAGGLSLGGLDAHARVQALKPKRGDTAARASYEQLFETDGQQASSYDKAISATSELLRNVGLVLPTPPDLDRLTRYSFFFQFQFTLESPYISRDDDAFHIMDNPVRKDKVFQVPTVSAASWKGNLRWTAMKTDLEPVRDNPEQFARRRLRHTLLFGTEKGFETSRDWERFLDHRCATEADHAERCRDEACRKVHDSYRSLLRQEFRRSGGQALPHLAGSLHFYPTFFDKIGLEVINPHDRRTRAGRQPIFFECAPVTAKGTFSLLYVPLGQVTRVEALQDLATVEKAVSEMMLTYGFSAKKSSGFGTAMVKAGKLVLPGSPEQRFKTFTGLQDLVRLARQGQGTAEDS